MAARGATWAITRKSGDGREVPQRHVNLLVSIVPSVVRFSAVKAGSECVHQQHPAGLGLVLIDLWHQPGEVFGLAMGIECRLIGPLLDKDKVPRVFLIDKQIVGDAQRFLAVFPPVRRTTGAPCPGVRA